jgi:hypothetical protein
MPISYYKNAGQNYNKETNKSFKNIAEFKYLGITLTNQNHIYGRIKGRLHLGNDYYHSVQDLSSSHLLT